MGSSSPWSSDSGSGYDSSGSGYDSSSSSSSGRSQSSADEEVPRSPPKRHADLEDDDDGMVVFNDAVFEQLGQRNRRLGKKKKDMNVSKSKRSSLYEDTPSDDTATEIDSDVVSSRRKRRRSSFHSSLSSDVSGDELGRNKQVVTDDEGDENHNDPAVAAEVDAAIFDAERKVQPGVPRPLRRFQDAEDSDMLPSTANFFCCGCKAIQHGYIVDGQVLERPYRQIQSILEELRTRFNIRLIGEQR